ncbi:uncharacterized protein G2W53_039432 [Senna tora]|uniref:Uncharacterized protein n=1 Tax=Senna tora TaxID=362788 RepID=A0A834SPI4_9FABA|nr:uncharacterized protein G2W53_039432 [Senna tora]
MKDDRRDGRRTGRKEVRTLQRFSLLKAACTGV